MDENTIILSSEVKNTVADFSDEPNKTFVLSGFSKCKYLQYAVTTQCAEDHYIVLNCENSEEKTVILDKKDRRYHYEQRSNGFLTVNSGDTITLTSDFPLRALISKSTLVSNGILKAITYTLVFDAPGNDKDFNDICISITAWVKKD